MSKSGEGGHIKLILQEICDLETPRTGLAIAYGEFKLADSVAASIGARDCVLVGLSALSYCV